MVIALRTLCATLPVQLVIRLCTDDDETIKFYNEIDEELELPLDILDDMVSEAQELAACGNDWFAYTPVLHRIWESGALSSILDAMDERQLTPAEVRKLAELLSGSPRSLEGLSTGEFIDEMKRMVASAPLVYDARHQDMRPVLDIFKLRAALRHGIRGRILPLL